MGDAFQPDGRKRRIEATQLRKTVFGKKHSRLDDTKVCFPLESFGVQNINGLVMIGR